MKLLVVVLCLLCERYFVHARSQDRLHFVSTAGLAIAVRLSKFSFLSSPWLILVLSILPWFLIVAFLFYFLANLGFGLVGFLLSIIVLYACLGPDNPFFPVRCKADELVCNDEVENYLAQVNGQLFAVLFWYMVLGPLAVLLYRLISLNQNQALTSQQATCVTAVLDWIPARMVALFYLLVGHFQAGKHHYIQSFFLSPLNNKTLLGVCGMQALGYQENEVVTMPQAENLVEHALILFLVLMACFTFLLWM